MNIAEWNPISLRPAKQLRSMDLLARLTAIGALLALIVCLFLYAGGWLTPRTLTPASMVDTFEYLNGMHSGFRRNHAKGICVTGYFESNGNGQALSRAAVFQPGRVPVAGRFAFSGGKPDVADSPKTVRSLAILFQMPDGEEWRTAMINIPVFPVNTPSAFRDFLLASSPNPATGKQDPAAMPGFLARHPETAAAMKIIGSHPFSSGFGDSPYYALHAFRFINTNGESVPVRWSVVPAQAFETASSGAAGNNYLFDTLIARIHTKPLHWRMILTVGQPGDPTADATLPWPPDRKQIVAGTLTINSIESEDTSPIRDINFDPLILPDGIAPSDDPLLSARSAAYSQSFTRREGERKIPSAISAREAGK
jgi:catalase